MQATNMKTELRLGTRLCGFFASTLAATTFLVLFA